MFGFGSRSREIFPEENVYDRGVEVADSDTIQKDTTTSLILEAAQSRADELGPGRQFTVEVPFRGSVSPEEMESEILMQAGEYGVMRIDGPRLKKISEGVGASVLKQLVAVRFQSTGSVVKGAS